MAPASGALNGFPDSLSDNLESGTPIPASLAADGLVVTSARKMLT
jgi:hypothetical protein